MESVQHILFIGNSRIGDFILASGVLASLIDRFPNARVTVFCGPSCVSLLEDIPQIERIIALPKLPYHGHWIRLWYATIKTAWDIVVDVRNTPISRLLWSKKRYSYRPSSRPEHRVESLQHILGSPVTVSPHLWISEKHRRTADSRLPAGPPVIAFGPGSTWAPKQWPSERFAELAIALAAPNGPWPGARIMALGSQGERPAAEPLLATFPPHQCFDFMDGTPLLETAALLERCVLYIGNDNGQMHLSAATGVPTLGLFGPTDPALYRPWGPRTSFIRSPDHTMNGLTVDAVVAAVRQMPSI